MLASKLEKGKGYTVLYVSMLYDIKRVNKLVSATRKRMKTEGLIVATAVRFSRLMLDKP